jgi:hypothetical protein
MLSKRKAKNLRVMAKVKANKILNKDRTTRLMKIKKRKRLSEHVI